ncbi:MULTISPECIES: hypothetical protein, partial [Enterobacteriaceae]
VTLKMPAFEWVHVQLHQQKGMISLSPPTICNSASDYDFDSSIYDDYAMPQTSQAEQSHTGKEHTHEHEEGGHEI